MCTTFRLAMLPLLAAAFLMPRRAAGSDDLGGDETAPQPMKVTVKDVSIESR